MLARKNIQYFGRRDDLPSDAFPHPRARQPIEGRWVRCDRLTRDLEPLLEHPQGTLSRRASTVIDAAGRIVRVDRAPEMRGGSLILATGTSPRPRPDADRPTRLVNLAYLGGVTLTIGMVTLGIGRLRAT